MRRLHSIRWSRIPLLILPLTACHSWQASPVTPQELFAGEAPTEVRITTTDAHTITLQHPHLMGDTLSGRTGRTGRDVKAFATADIAKVDVRKFSAGKTVGLVLGITLPFAAMVAVGNSTDDIGYGGGCPGCIPLP